MYKTGKQQGPNCSTGNYTQCLVITYNGKESEKEYITHTHIHKLSQFTLTIYSVKYTWN